MLTLEITSKLKQVEVCKKNETELGLIFLHDRRLRFGHRVSQFGRTFYFWANSSIILCTNFLPTLFNFHQNKPHFMLPFVAVNTFLFIAFALASIVFTIGIFIGSDIYSHGVWIALIIGTGLYSQLKWNLRSEQFCIFIRNFSIKNRDILI